MLLKFDAVGRPSVQDFEFLGAGVIAHAWAVPGNRVLKMARRLDASLQWLEHCHWVLKTYGPDHPKMWGKPRVYMVRRWIDEEGDHRYWALMEHLREAGYGQGGDYRHNPRYEEVQAEAVRVLGITGADYPAKDYLDDHAGNVMYRRGPDGEWNFDEPLLCDPSAGYYEENKPSRVKKLSRPRHNTAPRVQ